MMTKDFNIRSIRPEDFSDAGDLPPRDWNFDYTDFLKNHFQEKFFYAVVIYTDTGIVGTGNAFNFGESGWLGNIIVKPAYRRQGIGLSITRHLCRHLTEKGCKTMLLLASDEGRSVYQRAGFRTVTKYRYFTSCNETPVSLPGEIRRIEESDLEKVFEMDCQATGEDRQLLILKSFENGWVYDNGSSISGFYLPDFGRGVVIAIDGQAGLKLLELKHSIRNARSGIPVNNHEAIKFFENSDYTEISPCTRMMIGMEIGWSPGSIYSYAHGYCG